MNKYSLSHTKWKCQYHIIFIPKYRQKVLYGKLRGDRPCTFMCKYTSERKCIKFYRIFKRKKCDKNI